MVWLYISVIMAMRAVQSLFTKKNASSVPKNAEGYIKYTAYYEGVAALLAAILFAATCRGAVVGAGKTAVYASVSGVCLALSCMCGIYTLSTGTMALNSLFATAGLLVPAVAGMFLYGEALKWWQWCAVALFMVGAWLLVGTSSSLYGKFTRKNLCVLLCSLVANGVTMLMQKMFGMEVTGGNVSLFSLISFASGVILLLILLAAVSSAGKRRHGRVAPAEQAGRETPAAELAAGDALFEAGEREAENRSACPFRLFADSRAEARLPKNVFLYGLALAAAVFLINQLATLSAPLMSSVALFALINGGATVISALVGALFFRERLTARSVLGLAVGIGALVLVQVG